MRDYRLYLRDIYDAIEAIESFVEGMTLAEFEQDDKTSSAVIRKFEIIGEATKNIPETVREQQPTVPWKQMAGMRDKLIHHYFGINYGLVWSAIKQSLPKIKPVLEQMLDK